MKKLLALTSAIVAGFASTASADVAVSGSGKIGVINDGAASSSKTEVQMGSGVSFAMSATTSNGMVIGTSMGLTRTTSAADTAAKVSGGDSFTFTTSGMSLTVGNHKITGRDTGDVGSVISDFMANESISSTAEAALDDVKGQGFTMSTSMGTASVAFSYIWDASPGVTTAATTGTTVNKGATDASDTAFGFSASMPMGAFTLGLGYAGHDDGSNNDTTTGANVAYAVGGGTLTVGYQSTTEPSNNATKTSGKYVTSLDADTTASIGYSTTKEGSNSSSRTTAALSRALGGGASVFAEIDNRSGSGGSITTGSAFSIGTSVSF
jgi:hypothetical protein